MSSGSAAPASTPPCRTSCWPAARSGLPEDVDTFAMMPIGWPIDPFGPLTRRPVAEVVHADRWGQPWPA